MVRVIYRAKKFGWRHAHAGRALGMHGGVITPMMPGWPDLVLLKPGHLPIFAELKRELGKLSPEQESVLTLLDHSFQRTFVWKPSDLRLGKVEAILREGPHVR